MDYEANALLEPRYNHVSWDSPEGVIMMGGDVSGNTTENVRTGQEVFSLKYETRKACGINLGAWVVLTGGAEDLLHRVSEYDLQGWTRDLPQLSHGRERHGCSHFLNSAGLRTLLVTGGYYRGFISSTEILQAVWSTSMSRTVPRSCSASTLMP